MQPMVLAALAALVLLSAPPAALAATLLRDVRRGRRPLPTRPALARVALMLNAERAATPGQCRLARLRRRLFESCEAARVSVPAGDDLHAEWLLGDAMRLARRLDTELRELWTAADAAPERLERAAARVDAVVAALARLREAVAVRAGFGADALVAHLAGGVDAEHAVRLHVGGLLHRGGGLSLPARDTPERAGPPVGHIVRTGASAP
ncbi:MAG TPA: hypothetical protein VF112_07960 [Candidatus Dormibacteraeota bacterium]